MRFVIRSTVGVIACLALFQAAAASAATLPEGTTAILSGNTLLSAPLPAPVTSSETKSSAVSQNGRFVAFQSQSDGLYDGDDDRVSNVYVRDRVSGAIILASRATGKDGEPSHSYCYQPAMSDDGSRVAFTCDGPLDPADTNAPASDVYVRGLSSSTTHLVSRASGAGAVGNRASSSPSMSDTGEFVAFESESTNLDPSATTDRSRIYRRQIDFGGATVLVSRRTGADGAPAEGHEPSIADDGSRIAFTSDPLEAIDAADTNSFADVYVRDMAAATTVLASRADGAGDVGNGPPRLPRSPGTAPPSPSSPRRTSSTTTTTRTPRRTSTDERSRRRRPRSSASTPPGRRASPRRGRPSTTPGTSSRSSRPPRNSIRTTPIRRLTRT